MAQPNDIAGVLEAVRGLVPMLREKAGEMESNRNIIPEVVEALTDAGAFKLTIPTDHGGYEASLDEVGEVLAEIGRGDVSAAWVASLINGGNWWAGIVPDELSEELLSIPDLRMAGVITPSGKAEPIDGGYRVNGRWQWNTGGGIAHWGGFGAMTLTDQGPLPIFMLIPYSQLVFTNDFDATGMAGTGSGTTVAENVFVPLSHTIPVPEFAQGIFPQRSRSSQPYYNRPTMQFFSAESAGPLVGGARGAREVFMERLPGRMITYTNYASQADAPLTHHQLADAEYEIEIAEMFMRKGNATVDDHLGEEVPLQERIRTRAYLGQVANHARAAVTTLFQASGATAISRSVPIQRYFRDVNFLANHALIQPTSANELLGRSLAGLEPNSQFL